MGWEWRIFYQPAGDDEPPLPLPEESEVRTDVYYIQCADCGLKQRGGGILELKQRLAVDERGYEKWRKSSVNTPPSQGELRISIGKRRRQAQQDCASGWVTCEFTELTARRVDDGERDCDQRHGECAMSGRATSWRTVALEGKRNDCEALRASVLAWCRAHAMGGAVKVGGYPAFVCYLSGDSSAFAPLAVPVTAFSLSAIQRGAQDAFVLVHEKDERGWWLPGGGVDAGQTLDEAAVRESEEEAGCCTRLTGVLRVEYDRRKGRLRVIWHAVPVDASAPLKVFADAESRGACWVSLAEVRALDAGKAAIEHPWLRGCEPLWWFTHLSRGGGVARPSFVHSTREALPVPWSGPGSPPRAHYPTRTRVRVIVLPRTGDCARCLVRRSGVSAGETGSAPLSLPSDEVHAWEPLEEAARRLASTSCSLNARLVGVLCFEHSLCTGSRDAPAQYAMVTITYLATADEGGAATDDADSSSVEGAVWAAREAVARCEPACAPWLAEISAAATAAGEGDLLLACVAPLSALVESERAVPDHAARVPCVRDLK